MDKHPKVGVAGCHLVNEKGETIPHVRRMPTVLDQLAIILKIPHIFPGVLNKYLYKNFNYDQESEVDSIRGSFFMIRGELLQKIRGLDERYFIWFEEVDYCRRAREAGFKVMYTPVTECTDYIGKSFAQLPRGKTQKYFQDSMLKYFKKWHSLWEYILLAIAWPLGKIIARIGDFFKFKQKKQVN